MSNNAIINSNSTAATANTTLNQNKQTPIKIRNVIAAQQHTQYNNQQQQQPQQIKTTPNIIQINPVMHSSNMTQLNTSSPLRTLVINNKDNLLQSSLASNTSIANNYNFNTSNASNQTNNITPIYNGTNLNILTPTSSGANASVPSLLPLSFAINLHKQVFPHVDFKCLNFEELAVSLKFLSIRVTLSIEICEKLND